MEKAILDLMEEVTVEEMQLMEGQGGTGVAQCSWMLVSCENFIPGGGFGCGGYEMCKEYKKYCY
ncbi:hypothetical protein P4523_29520 [Bacillus toyonensis]|uniref:sublancin family glycopeptide n=1 Tax=Bacillus toyonensis TaxID=155322 RepID=UPI002E1EE384|nr:hypothetical protein [Bacillus toyonensis]